MVVQESVCWDCISPGIQVVLSNTVKKASAPDRHFTTGQTAVQTSRRLGELTVLVAVRYPVLGSYLPHVSKSELRKVDPPQTIISLPVKRQCGESRSWRTGASSNPGISARIGICLPVSSSGA